jgi:hypothetical protein
VAPETSGPGESWLLAREVGAPRRQAWHRDGSAAARAGELSTRIVDGVDGVLARDTVKRCRLTGGWPRGDNFTLRPHQSPPVAWRGAQVRTFCNPADVVTRPTTIGNRITGSRSLPEG